MFTGQDVGALVLLEASASAYNREAYPEAAFAALLSSDGPSLTRRLLGSVPDRCSVVCKLSNDAAFASNEKVSVASSATDEVLRLFEAQGHARQWLRPLLSSGRAFTCVLEGDRQPRSACFAFESYRQIWEVGGVVTAMQHRGLGLASRVVRSALAELRRRSLIPRYQVEEDNLPSIRLATSISLRLFLRLTRFRTWPP